MNAFFSSMVWKRPWPNLEVVSMNLRSIFSRARRLVCTSKDCGGAGAVTQRKEPGSPQHPSAQGPPPEAKDPHSAIQWPEP